jgi:hypothetical protein
LRFDVLEDRTLLSADPLGTLTDSAGKPLLGGPAPVVGNGTGLVGSYYRDTTLTTVAHRRTDATVNFNWGTGSPAPGIANTRYSVRWTGLVQAQYSETYTFTTTADDGVRLYVNGRLLVNDWSDHGPRPASGSIALVAGQKYAVTMEYYQNAGGAVAQLQWASATTARQIVPTAQLYAVAPTGTGTGLNAQYYAGTNFNPPVLARRDAQINFNWGTAAVGTGVPADNWSARWTGQVEARYTETYTFTTRSDDGVRLFVNGQKIIDNWTNHAVTENSGSIRLVAGQKYNIELQFYDATREAVAQLYWASPSTTRQLVPTSQLYASTLPPPTPTPPPTPPRGSLSAPNVTSTGGTTHTFTVTYTDDVAVDVSSLGTGDVRVSGPNWYSQVATFVGVNSSTNGTPRVATYRVTAPSGGWTSAANGTYTVSLVASQVRDTAGTYAAAATLGSFQVSVPVADWFSQNLRDASLVSLARSLKADGSLNRADMLSLFNQVKRDGSVSSNELTDLRTLVANAGTMGMTDPVRNLSNKVVNGDPANQRYQGMTLGNLAAGSTGLTLERLVNKWFLGLDRPTGDGGATYVYAAGSLFGSGVSYTHVKQGQVSDCYFLAGLAEVAFRTPSMIGSMFLDNGDGTFAVRFFNGGVADYVTVDRYLPAVNGLFRYANFQASLTDPNNRLWVALAEKAYAQLAESGWSRDGAKPNAYSSLALGWEGNAVQQISGRNPVLQTLGGDGATLTAIVNAFNGGKMVGLDTRTSTASGIVANHVYVMTGYNSATQTFSLYNPWGYAQQLTWAQVAANFNYWSHA